MVLSTFDWMVMVATLGFIVSYGAWVSSGSKNIHGYLLGGAEAKWWTVGISVMATQASAITFLSTPGQAFNDGMGFVQFYFGLPIAMVIICMYFIPIYKRLKVYTAYEYLESRFDINTRTLTATLFLIQRGMAAGITIFAPAIILSSILGWDLRLTNLVIGSLVIVYTLTGGTKAVNVTHKYQMAVIFIGLVATFIILLNKLPENIGFMQAMEIAGASDKLNVLDFSFDFDNRYTFWSGIIGGSFLALSYFGTDQSQVQRYLSGASVKESQMGLIFNALLKVPMQFFILLVGVMVFVFYQFNSSPINFNPNVMDSIKDPVTVNKIRVLEDSLQQIRDGRTKVLNHFSANQKPANKSKNMVAYYNALEKGVRKDAREVISAANSNSVTNDKDYVFIHFILHNLPKGLIGLLLAVMLSAAMSSTASEINALAATTTVDIYKRSINSKGSDLHYVKASKSFTLMWGLIAIAFASICNLFENLIQFVNIIGSLFYGTILGVFLAAFFVKQIGARAIFFAAIISEILVIGIWLTDEVPYLWLNLIGTILTLIIAMAIQSLIGNKKRLID